MSLGRNILWNLLAFLWFTLLVLFVTPFMVGRLGLDGFGVWAVIAASLGYFAAMDLGLGNALIRFLATRHESGDRAGLEAFLRSGLTLQVGLGSLLGLTMGLLAGRIVHAWLHVPDALVGETIIAFRVAALSMVLGFGVVSYAAVPAALHRFDLVAARTLVFVSAQYLLWIWVLARGGGLLGVVVVHLVATILSLAYHVVIARRLLPGVRIHPGWDHAAAGELLRFGRYKFPAQIASSFMQQFDRIALGGLLPVAMVTYYAVPLRITQRIGQVVENIAAPFYPVVASHLVAHRYRSLAMQYRLGVRMAAVVSCGAVAVLGGLAHPVLSVWMGEEFAQQGTEAFRILLFAYAAGALFTLPSVAADAAGRPGIPAAVLVTGGLLHAFLVWGWIPRFGIEGAAAGVLCGYVVILTVGVASIHARIPALPSVLSLVRACLGSVVAGLATGIAAVHVAGSGYPGSGPGPLLLSLAGAGMLYLALLFATRGLLIGDFRILLGGLPATPGEAER